MEGDICCKRAHGPCRHDIQEARERYELRVLQLRHKQQAPGITRGDREWLQRKIDALPHPDRSHLCPNCLQYENQGQSHQRVYDSAYGEISSFTCAKRTF